jgi:hypothetical protein
LIPVCYVPVAVGGQGNCADSWDPTLIFDPSFADNQPCAEHPMKLFLDHSMLFVGSIWKNKSG